MDGRDFKQAFGQAPDPFKRDLARALQHMEEPPMKKMRFRTSIVLACLLIILAGVGLAAVSELGVLDFFKRSPIAPLPEAETMVQTEMGQTGGDLDAVTFTVIDALYDGEEIHLAVRVSPKDASKVMLAETDAMLADRYRGTDTSIGKIAAETNRRVLAVDGHGLLIGDTYFVESSYGLYEGDDLVLYLSGHYASTEPVNVTGNVLYRDLTAPEAERVTGPIAFTLDPHAESTLLTVDTPMEADWITVEGATLRYSPLSLYVEITYRANEKATPLQLKRLPILAIDLLDAQGGLIGSSGGGTTEVTLPDGTQGYRVSGTWQTSREPYDSLTVRFFNAFSKDRFGSVTFTKEDMHP